MALGWPRWIRRLSDVVLHRVSKNNRRNLCEVRDVFGYRPTFCGSHCGVQRPIGELALEHAKEGRIASKRLQIEAVLQTLQARQFPHERYMVLYIMCLERICVRLGRIEDEELFHCEILSALHG